MTRTADGSLVSSGVYWKEGIRGFLFDVHLQQKPGFYQYENEVGRLPSDNLTECSSTTGRVPSRLNLEHFVFHDFVDIAEYQPLSTDTVWYFVLFYPPCRPFAIYRMPLWLGRVQDASL